MDDFIRGVKRLVLEPHLGQRVRFYALFTGETRRHRVAGKLYLLHDVRIHAVDGETVGDGHLWATRPHFVENYEPLPNQRCTFTAEIYRYQKWIPTRGMFMYQYGIRNVKKLERVQ